MLVSLQTAEQCIRYYIEQDIACHIWGPPGVGKSQLVHWIKKSLKWGLVDIRLSLRDPVDLRGLPLVDAKTGTTRWLSPDELPQEKRDGKYGILFLDEANIASQAMQGAAMGLVLDRKLGEYKLPPGWRVIAAGNRLADRAAAQRMGTALKNRFAHIEVGVDTESFCAWAIRENIHPMMVAWARFRPALLHMMPQGEENSFPTPRAWEQVAKCITAPTAIRQTLVEGLVGNAAAGEFEAFCRVYEQLPDFGEIIKRPKQAAVPADNQPGVLYAVSSALGRMATMDNFNSIVEYASRLPKTHTVAMMTDALRRTPKLKNTSAYARWAVDNQDIMI